LDPAKVNNQRLWDPQDPEWYVTIDAVSRDIPWSDHACDRTVTPRYTNRVTECAKRANVTQCVT